MERMGALRLRNHGSTGPQVVVLHGGPAAAGSAGPLARGLADSFRVLEPWQRGSGGEPLTVARHVEDLHDLVMSRCAGACPAIVGESWGAMLALAYAAAHPYRAGPLVLVGCGTFDPASRAGLQATLAARTARAERLYDFAPIGASEDDAGEPFDVTAHTETWQDMLRLQEAGVYPAAFAAIASPVLMLHGAYDPHPGQMIRASLAPYLPRLDYREWEKCGHSPWAERYVRDAFFAALREWLIEHSPA